jgi:predicted nucleic acid-binding Zn ribbon protein
MTHIWRWNKLYRERCGQPCELIVATGMVRFEDGFECYPPLGAIINRTSRKDLTTRAPKALAYCVQCGGTIHHRQKHQKFCSAACVKASRRIAPRECPVCGDPFVPRNKPQRVCSIACRGVARRKVAV